MTTWDGYERRKDKTYHDLLIRIDANMTNLIKEFEEHKEGSLDWREKHQAENDYKFIEGGIRMTKLERNQYIAIGGILVLQILINVFIK